MSLDDLMTCMAKGMVLGFLTLMLGVLALGLTLDSGADARSDDLEALQATPAVEQTSDLTAEDLAHLEHRTWSESIWCALRANENPKVSIIASMVTERGHVGFDHPACDAHESADLAPDIRAEALKQAWDDPAVVAMVYAADCHRKQEAAHCDHALLQERLTTLDPDNAFAHLLAIGERPLNAYGARGDLSFSAHERRQLARAAASTHYREYAFAGVHDTYRAFEQEMARQGPFELSADARPDLPEAHLEGIDLGLAWSTHTVFAILIARVSAGYSALLDGCKAAAAAGDTDTIAHCLEVADLMITSDRNYIAIGIGRALRHSLEHPEAIAQERAEQDPMRWRHGLVRHCEMRRGLPGTDDRLPGPMPMAHLANFLVDYQVHGEVTANRNASAREFAAYPEAFAMDPARCRDILALDTASQTQLLEWLDEESLKSMDDVLREASELVDTREAEAGS